MMKRYPIGCQRGSETGLTGFAANNVAREIDPAAAT